MVFNSKNEQLLFFVTPKKRHKRYTVVCITQKLGGKIIFWCKSEPSKRGVQHKVILKTHMWGFIPYKIGDTREKLSWHPMFSGKKPPELGGARTKFYGYPRFLKVFKKLF
jgi:hypothetical protein